MPYYYDHPFMGSHWFAGGMFAAGVGLLILVVFLWTIFWKAWALWKAARSGNKIWFIVLLLVNTLGILDILYIYFFSEHKKVTMKGLREMVKPESEVKDEPSHDHKHEDHH